MGAAVNDPLQSSQQPQETWGQTGIQVRPSQPRTSCIRQYQPQNRGKTRVDTGSCHIPRPEPRTCDPGPAWHQLSPQDSDHHTATEGQVLLAVPWRVHNSHSPWLFKGLGLKHASPLGLGLYQAANPKEPWLLLGQGEAWSKFRYHYWSCILYSVSYMRWTPLITELYPDSRAQPINSDPKLLSYPLSRALLPRRGSQMPGKTRHLLQSPT